MECKCCKRKINDKYAFCPYCGTNNTEEFKTNTLGEIYQEWKEEKYPNIDKSTIINYEYAWKKIEVYKYNRIDSLKTRDYQKIINEMRDNDYSRSTLEKVRILVTQLCKYALKNDIITKNYGSFLVLPKKSKNGRTRFTDEELAVFWNNTDIRTVRIILILAYSGLRINELFELRRDAVYPYEKIPYLIGGSKTEAGKDRTVVISPLIIDFVKDEYEKGSDYLIPNCKGGMIDDHNWRRREYYPTLEKLNVEKRPIHCLRHTFASLMFKAGAEQKALMELMGHAHISTTAEVYAHTDLEQLHNAIMLLNKVTPYDGTQVKLNLYF